jgi:hypothetical protein
LSTFEEVRQEYRASLSSQPDSSRNKYEPATSVTYEQRLTPVLRSEILKNPPVIATETKIDANKEYGDTAGSYFGTTQNHTSNQENKPNNSSPTPQLDKSGFSADYTYKQSMHEIMPI